HHSLPPSSSFQPSPHHRDLPSFPTRRSSDLMGRRSLSGSPIGGIVETQEMLDFCGQHNITAEVEVIPIQKINEAYDRLVKSDVRSEEHTSELQSRGHLVCRLLLEKKKKNKIA